MKTYDIKNSAEISPASVPEYSARVACLPEDQPCTRGHPLAPGLDCQHDNSSSIQATHTTTSLTPTECSARIACLQGDQTSTQGHPLAPGLDCQQDNTPSVAPTECPVSVVCLQKDKTSTKGNPLAPSPTCQQDDFNSAIGPSKHLRKPRIFSYFFSRQYWNS